MDTSKCVYRKVNPYSDEDMKKYLKSMNSLDVFLNKKEVSFTPDQIKWLRIRMGATNFLEHWSEEGMAYKQALEKFADEHCFFCEYNGEVMGHIFICTYHLDENKDRANDDIGVITEIFVTEKCRGTDIAYNLLQLGLETLLKAGKNRALLTVQEDNPNRFLHFAMADTMLKEYETTRANGNKTKSYDLLISDVKKLKEMSYLSLAKKAAKIKRNFEQNNLSHPEFIID